MKTLKTDIIKIAFGTAEVATKKGLGLIVGLGECAGELLVEIVETAERVGYMEKEIRLLS